MKRREEKGRKGMRIMMKRSNCTFHSIIHSIISLLPMLVNLQIGGISNNPQGLLRSCQGHIQSTLIGQKSQALHILWPFQARSYAGKNNDVGLAALERVHGANFDKFVLFRQVMLRENVVNCISNRFNLSYVGSNYTDGIICLRRR